MKFTGRVLRVGEDRARGTLTLQGVCSCPWPGTERVVVRDRGSDGANARATNDIARKVEAHFAVAHPEAMS